MQCRTRGAGAVRVCGEANLARTTSSVPAAHTPRLVHRALTPCDTVQHCARDTLWPAWGGCTPSWWRCAATPARSTGACAWWEAPTWPRRSSSPGYTPCSAGPRHSRAGVNTPGAPVTALFVNKTLSRLTSNQICGSYTRFGWLSQETLNSIIFKTIIRAGLDYFIIYPGH